ncbi:MAG: hypothetical protein H7336_03285 [Bacteriovorax sp.]|nr:hypothetical protein [Bacteriovorax sp.]
MQGMPAKIMPQKPQHSAVKTDVKASTTANNKLNVNPASYGKQSAPVEDTKGKTAVATPAVQVEAEKNESKGSFADLFAGLVGNEATKVEGKGEKVEKLPADMALEVKQQSTAETKVDSLLKVKGQNQGTEKNNDISAMTTEKAISPDVLKNINNLIQRNPPTDKKTEGTENSVDEKIVATSTNLDQLLKSLRGHAKEETNTDDSVEIGADGKEIKDTKGVKNTKSTPLDFLLKQSKESDVVSADAAKIDKNGKLLNSNPETVSKLGLSSEDFVSQMKDAKNVKGEKSQTAKIDLEGQTFDPQELLSKSMNASVKSYGQKQNILDSGLIKNTNDLAFKDTKFKASTDEMTVGATKVGADLSQIKESFIPVMGKQDQSGQTDTQNAGKVLDLSKMDTANHTEIIKRISDYVQQSQVANSSSLDLTVKHESLGQFQIQVNKPLDPRSQAMDMQITTSTAEGHDFFVKNEIGLMKNLNQAGIQLSDLRIVSGGESAGFTQTDSRQSGHNGNSQQAPREFMSFENGDHSQGSDRRKELWQEARANQQRYGA